MKISELIRSAQTPEEQEQTYSNEWLSEEKDPEAALPVDEATEAEDAEETKPSEMESLTQGSKTVVDTGFLTKGEKELLRRCGWKIVAK